MPDVPVTEEELKDILQCGCDIKGALLEMVFVKLGIIGKDVAKEKLAGERVGWRCLSRGERERHLKWAELQGQDIDDIIMQIQE